MLTEEAIRLINKACELYRKDLILINKMTSCVKRLNNIIDIQGSVDDFRKKLLEEGGKE